MKRAGIHRAAGAVALVAAATWIPGGAAQAQTAGPGTTFAVSPVNQCTLQGSTHMPANLEIYGQYQGGSPVAKFTGGKITLTAHHFPLDPSRGRVSVRTGSGSGGFRIDGFIDTTKLPIVTKHEISAHQGHVWIGAAQQVQFVKATASDLRVTLTLKRPMSQSFTAQSGCSAFTLSPGIPPGWAVPGNARGYVVKQDSVELYDDWRAERGYVTNLRLANGLLMWSTERRGAFVRVQYHGRVVIDAWAKASDFRMLPWGEREDRQAAPVSRPTAPTLRLAETPREVTATVEVPIHSAARTGAPVIGAIEAGATVYVLDVMVGWASVMPKALNLAPHGDGSFWVEAAKLGLQRGAADPPATAAGGR